MKIELDFSQDNEKLGVVAIILVSSYTGKPI